MVQICTSCWAINAGLYCKKNKSALHAEPLLLKPHLNEMGKLNIHMAQMHALLESSVCAGLYCK